mmetsp:Transcript_8009/g.20024  ORF Transcript_8009/g.20024 Transcript_8009/m.20024 type:complete len:106 (-) Transcript_8009:1181-1498(-)
MMLQLPQAAVARCAGAGEAAGACSGVERCRTAQAAAVGQRRSDPAWPLLLYVMLTAPLLNCGQHAGQSWKVSSISTLRAMQPAQQDQRRLCGIMQKSALDAGMCY